MNKKIVLAIGLLILLAGGIFAWQYFGAPEERVEVPKEEVKVPEEAAKDETADWQTYRNEEYEFEVKWVCGDSLLDNRDGKRYATILIGEQCWMAENLNYAVSNYNYWCPDNDCNNRNNYGLLYDWSAALEACPEGWHLPSHNEWRTLVNFLGSDSGMKLKASDNDIPGWDGTNESGFTALPAGFRHTDNGFYGFGSGTRFWSSVNNWVWILRSDRSSISPNLVTDRDSGLSVRCIKEIESLENWSIYKNKELGFEMRVPPLFEEIGCTIREIFSQPSVLDNKECFVLSFDTMPTDPPWLKDDRLGEFIRLYVCPLSYCEEEGLGELCEAIKRDEGFNGIFTDYITESSQYFIYVQTFHGQGDFFEAMGWVNPEVLMLRHLMISSIKFIDDLSEEEQKKWMEEESNAKCDYDDDFVNDALG